MMINPQKVEKSKIAQPNILMFASPAITPSNNYKLKVDSPQLRVMKDQIDRPQPQSNNITVMNQNKRDDFISLYNYQNQIRDLNHTNKEIQKKQFDFNINKQKANVTIQYDTYDQVKQQHQQQQQQHALKQLEPQLKHHKQSKSICTTQKRRQQSQSMPRHQPSASIVNTQAQPLINLHIQNAKLAHQIKPQPQIHKRRPQQAENQLAQMKYQSNPGLQSAQQKSRSKSKNRQKSVQNTTANHYHNNNQNKPSFIANATKEILNQSNYNNQRNPINKNNQFLFSFDNKENESINYNDFSPSRIVAKPETRINNYLDSDSSQGSPRVAQDQFIAQKLEKSYFMDKSALLRHLSPDKSSNNSKSRINKSSIVNYSSFMPQQILSDRDLKYSQNNIQNYKSNGSTILHNQAINESSFNNQNNQSIMQLKIKRSGTLGNSGNNKLFLKGVDKLIKENLKRNKTKEQEEISKRYMEEFKQKLKKVELSQRNQQVRKINASKIFYNHQHKNSMIQNRINIQRVGAYKKQRSKSCMNKTDNIFGQGGIGNGPRSRERLPQNNYKPQQFEQQFQHPVYDVKKEKKREKSCVLEIKELQKQVDGEIRREIMEGKIDIQPTSANNKKSNLSTINVKKEQAPVHKIKKDILNMSAIEQAIHIVKRSKEDLTGDDSNKNLSKPRRKSKSKENGNKSISQNIKKFMDKKKNAHLQLKSLEQTIENQKSNKMKENLKSLHQFAKQHFRHQSYNFYPKKNNVGGLINHLESESSKALHLKTLKPQFFKTKQKKKSTDKLSKKAFDYKGETIFDNDGRGYIEDDRDGADISQELFEDYQRVVRSQKNKKRQQNGDQSSSIETSPLRNKSSSKKQKRIKPVYQSQLQNELEQSLLLNQKARYSQNDSNIISIDQQQYQSIKNDFVQLPSVVQEKGASLIPPQSDIATLDRNYLDRSQYKIFDSTEKRRFTDKRRSQESGTVSNKSPKLSEQKQKIRLLMSRYGYNLPQSQLNAPQADKKLLIKLHSAAITIQQHFRDHLQRSGFYYLGSSNSQSNMYIDSEEDQNNYNYDLSDQKSVQKQLVAQTSPLRVKSKYQQQKYYQQNPQQMENQQKTSKFYSADSSDVEKVIVCSVITSGRAENDESLSNTQKYVPLRQKVMIPPSQKVQQYVNPQYQQQQKQQQQQFQQQTFNVEKQKYNQIPSSTSSAQSGFNTVIKTKVIPLQQRLQSESIHESLDVSQQSSSSQRKKIVPALDFGKLKAKEESKEHQTVPLNQQVYQIEETKSEQPGSNTARSMFERHSFQEYVQKLGNGESFNVNNYPEMLKMREEAIKYKEMEESKILQKMVKTKQMSPRTYDIKRQELESRVSKEKEEVKKTKKVFEEYWQKTADIIEQTNQKNEKMRKMFGENQTTHGHNNNLLHPMRTNDSLPSEHTLQNIQQSHRQSSRRDTTHLLDMIDDYPKQDPIQKQKEDHLQQEQLKRQAAEQIKKEQEKQRLIDEDKMKKEQERKREMELLKELERQKDEERKERLRQEELERQRDAEKKRILELEKEKERLKQEEAERLKRFQEEQRLKEQQRRQEEERKQRELEEKQRKEKELEDKRLRDLQIQKQQQLELEEKNQREIELKKKQEEEKKKRDQEEAERIRKQKEIEEKIKRDQEEQKKYQEEQLAKLKKQKEDEEKQRQQDLLKELEEIDRRNKEKEDQERKKREEQRLKQEREDQEERERLIAQMDQKSDRYIDSSEKEDNHFNRDSSDEDMFENENNLIRDIIHEPRKGKEVLESLEDEKYQNEPSSILDFQTHHNQRNQDDLARDDEPRGLSRTRSSQYLNDNKFDEDISEIMPLSRENLLEQDVIDTKLQDQNLNDESMDEDMLAEQLVRRQEAQNQALGSLVLNESFFSKNFDDQKPEDLINMFQKQLDDSTQDQTNQFANHSLNAQNNSQEKIFVSDGVEEMKDSGVIEPKFKFEDKKNQRLSQEMRNQIPVEEEEHINPGMPVSPVSADGNDIRIQTGAQSLESTLSDGTEFRNAIQEARNQEPQDITANLDLQVDKITDDIFRQLLAEMKVELDLLLLTDPRRLFREEANSNQFLSESGRFLIFERRGIKTDLFAIEHYVEEVLEEILKDKERFNTSISQPISKNANEVLNQLQNSEIGSYEHFDVNYPQVLPLDLYLKLEKRRKENRESQNQENQASDRNIQDRNFLAECEHIHNKVLFDCINDSLLQFKQHTIFYIKIQTLWKRRYAITMEQIKQKTKTY